MTLWGDGNLVRLLRVGTTRIQPSRAEGPTCGLVPLARPATASSTGLKWNLDNTHVSLCAVQRALGLAAFDKVHAVSRAGTSGDVVFGVAPVK
jgi:thiamine pyrophosphokinase